EDGEGTGAIAAFDSGMRVAPDENTNSLVIIANLEDFAVVEKVIKSLDIERRQVYIDAVLLELSSEDTLDFSLAGHFPVKPSDEISVGVAGAQLGTSSVFGLTQDLLTGVALGVFGPGIPFTDPATGIETTIPAFGVVLNALKSNSAVNIISNPGVAAMDNEEARIVVGRKIPFPTTSGLNSLGQPVVSFQREDVAITLEVTPRVNSSNYVTMEVKIEAQEIEEDDQGLSAAQTGGPTTSTRELETVALVQDNQTMVVGGLVGTTDTEVETKVPILGDLPVLGAFFRGTRDSSRKTNLIIFLTPHIIDDPEDMIEIQRVKEAQRMEFLRRFYGKSRDEYMREMNDLLRYSMNFVDEPSVFRGADTVIQDLSLEDQPVSNETREAIEAELDNAGVRPEPTDAPTEEIVP
ncbi:MAG: hypothetical protein H0V89_06745, partial [Deltaproteobacteria bacterium]|nr:hypothetical protein [Deltaproteobacteria bacterium]